MKKQVVLVCATLLMVVLGACSKKMGELPSDLFKVEPSPLEVKGGKIEATINGKFPAKYFNKNAVVTVTPILKFAGKELAGEGKSFQGEKVKGNDQVIETKGGGTFELGASFDYQPEMAKSELFLDFQVNVKGKVLTTIPQVKVADGVMATAASVGTDADEIGVALAVDNFQRVIQEQQNAEIKFLIQQSNLRSSETKSALVKELIAAIQDVKKSENKQITSLNVLGYASPDGSFDLNKNLAEKRSKVATNFLKGQLKRLKADAEVNVNFTPEDWDGFQKLVEESDIEDKELILRVLSNIEDPEQREIEIKNMAAAYVVLAEQILPQLRRSKLQLVVDVTGKSDEEISDLSKNSPSTLSVEELLYAATLTNDASEKEVLYGKTVEYYPEDFRAYNNLAFLKLLANESADELLATAKNLAPDSPDVNYNLGLVALNKGALAEAETYFENSAGTTGNLKVALGTLFVLKGDYVKAKTSFNGERSNNAAALEIVNKNYNEAKTILSQIEEPNAKTAYLSAILAARTNTAKDVYENMKQAVAKDKSYAEKAKNDIEFAKYLSDKDFLSVLE